MHFLKRGTCRISLAASVPLSALVWWSALWACPLGAVFLPLPAPHAPSLLACTSLHLGPPEPPSVPRPGCPGSSGFPALPPLKTSLYLGGSEDRPVPPGVMVPPTSVSSLEISRQACPLPSCLSLEPVAQALQTPPGQCLLRRPDTPGEPGM